MSFDGEKFSNLLKEKKITTLEMISALKDRFDIDITIDTMKSYRRKSGKNATPPLDKLQAIAEILEVSIDELSGKEKISAVNFVPITGTASCGACDINTLQDMTMKATIPQDEWSRNLYAVVACGDSMANEIYDGDIAIIDPLAPVENGDMVFYTIDEESAIKIFVDDKDNHLLNFIPFNTNENFKTRTIRKDDDVLMDRVIYHKVVHVISSKKNNRAARLKMIGR